MNRSLSMIILVVILLNIMLTTGCGQEQVGTSDNSDQAQTSTTGAPTQLPYTVDSSFPDETFADYLNASPFYTPAHYETLFMGSDFLNRREVLLKNLAGVTEMAEVNIIPFYWHLDSLQSETLMTYINVWEENQEDHQEVKEAIDYLKTEYAKQMTLIAKLMADIEVLKESTTTDPYIKAWEDYERTQKNIELSNRVLEYVTRVIEDGYYLEEYLNQKGLYDDYAWKMDFLKLMHENYDNDDWLWENLFLNMAEMVNSLKALELANAYATISVLEQAKSELTLAIYTVENTDQGPQLSPDEWGWVEASLAAQLQLLEDHIEAVKVFNGIEFNQAHAFTRTAFASESALQQSEQAMDQALDILNTPMRPAEKEESIFKKLISNARKKVTGFTGKLLEKASTATYKVAITYIGNDYGLSQEDIDEEKRMAEELEKQRIANGTAGSQVIRDGIKWIEDKENWIGNVAKDKLGKDSFIAKVIDGGARYGIQKITGSGKNAMILLDQNATDEEIVNAFIDVAKTTFDGLKIMDKITKNMDKEKADQLKSAYDEFNDNFDAVMEYFNLTTQPLKEDVAKSFEEDMVQIDSPDRIVEDASNLIEREENAIEKVAEILDRDFQSTASGHQDLMEYAKSNLNQFIESIATTIVRLPPDPTEPPTETEPVTTEPPTTEAATTPPVTTAPATTVPATTAPVTTAPQTTVAGKNPNIDYDYLSKRVGTYKGEIVTVETLYGGSEPYDEITIVIDNSNIIISSAGSTKTFGQAFSFTFEIVMSNMAGVISGQGMIPASMIYDPEKPAVSQHLAMVALTFSNSGESVVSEMRLFYGPSDKERFAGLRLEADKE